MLQPNGIHGFALSTHKSTPSCTHAISLRYYSSSNKNHITKQAGMDHLNGRLKVTQQQLEDAHETGTATTTAMVSVTAQLRQKLHDQDEIITSLDIDRIRQV